MRGGSFTRSLLVEGALGTGAWASSEGGIDDSPSAGPPAHRTGAPPASRRGGGAGGVALRLVPVYFASTPPVHPYYRIGLVAWLLWAVASLVSALVIWWKPPWATRLARPVVIAVLPLVPCVCGVLSDEDEMRQRSTLR